MNYIFWLIACIRNNYKSGGMLSALSCSNYNLFLKQPKPDLSLWQSVTCFAMLSRYSWHISFSILCVDLSLQGRWIPIFFFSFISTVFRIYSTCKVFDGGPTFCSVLVWSLPKMEGIQVLQEYRSIIIKDSLLSPVLWRFMADPFKLKQCYWSWVSGLSSSSLDSNSLLMLLSW